MTYTFESENASVREKTSEATDYPSLDKDDDTVYDLVIVWGGITWISAARYAQQSWLKVALLEKLRLSQRTTWGTTAKLSAQHYFVYHILVARHGKEVAQAYADANMHGIDEIERIASENNIDADFSRKNAYIFSQLEEKVDIMKNEAAVAKSLGLPASFVDEIDLPYDITGALRFENQAQFHPRKYLIPLAKKFVENGGVIYEKTEAKDIKPGNPHTLITEHWTLQAKHILQACTAPFWQHDLFEGKYWNKVSYGLAVELKEGEDYPQDMYLRTDDNIRTVRSMPLEKGKQRMIFGGESHNAEDRDPDPHYEILEKEVRKTYNVEKIHYRWLADDLMPYDKIPFIWALPSYDSIYVATWFRARGLARGVAAAQMIIQSIIGNPPKALQYFSPERLLESLKEEDRSEAIGY